MKRLTQRERVKRQLLEHGSITNVEAFQMQILRLSERIRELQEEGLVLSGDWVREDGKKTGTYRYTLVSRPAPKPRMVPQVVMIDGVRHVRLVPEARSAQIERPSAEDAGRSRGMQCSEPLR